MCVTVKIEGVDSKVSSFYTTDRVLGSRRLKRLVKDVDLEKLIPKGNGLKIEFGCGIAILSAAGNTEIMVNDGKLPDGKTAHIYPGNSCKITVANQQFKVSVFN